MKVPEKIQFHWKCTSFAITEWDEVQPFPRAWVPEVTGAASLWQAWIKPLTPDPLLCFSYRLLLTDTAAKLQAVKDKARQANDTAKDVLAQIKDLHQNLDGLKKNYNQLADSVAKTNAVVKDPSRNSKISFITLIIAFISSHSKSILDS